MSTRTGKETGSTHRPVADRCGWCSRTLPAPDDAWKRLTDPRARVVAANYCEPTKAEAADPSADGTSKCYRLAQRNPDTVAERLAARLAAAS